MTLPLIFSLLATSVLSVPAPGSPSADITASAGSVYMTDNDGEPTEGFVTLHNAGPADTLVSAVCPLAGRTLVVGPDNKTVTTLPVPAQQDLTLSGKTGHILLEATHFPVENGSLIPCSLSFQNAGTISVYLSATPAPGKS